jgi:hypothetical protein
MRIWSCWTLLLSRAILLKVNYTEKLFTAPLRPILVPWSSVDKLQKCVYIQSLCHVCSIQSGDILSVFYKWRLKLTASRPRHQIIRYIPFFQWRIEQYYPHLNSPADSVARKDTRYPSCFWAWIRIHDLEWMSWSSNPKELSYHCSL